MCMGLILPASSDNCLLCFELLICRRLPTRRDRLQVESELCGDIGPEVLEALPV